MRYFKIVIHRYWNLIEFRSNRNCSHLKWAIRRRTVDSRLSWPSNRWPHEVIALGLSKVWGSPDPAVDQLTSLTPVGPSNKHVVPNTSVCILNILSASVLIYQPNITGLNSRLTLMTLAASLQRSRFARKFQIQIQMLVLRLRMKPSSNRNRKLGIMSDAAAWRDLVCSTNWWLPDRLPDY